MKKVVFLGNPNVGKSALINGMSNSKITVGNWPGVTVEKIEADFVYKGERFEFFDLPGTYNFTNTHESQITTEAILEGDYDLIVNVVDATNLERNLNMTLIARELNKPMIVVLNFYDDVTKSGLIIDTNRLSKYLQVPVFKTSATKNEGLNEVLDYIREMPEDKSKKYNIYFDDDIDTCIQRIIDILIAEDFPKPSYGYEYLAIRLFEKEPHFTSEIPEKTLAKINHAIASSNISLQESTLTQINNKRYNQIQNILEHTIDKKGVSRYKMTRRIDRFVLNKWLGIPIFILLAVYFLSLVFNIANPIIDWLQGFLDGYIDFHLSNLITSWPDWLQDMIINGLLGGVGGVLTFIPLMFLIYLMMALLEESGIMARVAFVMDRALKGLGLNGKAFISMIIGLGCTVPAITSTRTLESKGQRKITALMLTFISCGARLPVYALFCAAFFPTSFGLVVTSLYLLGGLMAVLVAMVSKKFNIFQDDSKEAFTIEMPPYRLPRAKILLKNVNNRVKGFIKRVISVIMIVLFIMWGLSYFPNGDTKDSYLHDATEFVRPIFKPNGFGDSTVAVAAIPSSFVAKEAVVGTIKALTNTEEEESLDTPPEASIVYQLSLLKDALVDSVVSGVTLNLANVFDSGLDETGSQVINSASHMFSDDDGKPLEDAPLRAYAYMVFILLIVPCVVTVATIKKEFGTSFMFQAIGLTLVVPYVVSIIIYQVGRLIFF